MATVNPFDLLGDDDAEDPSQLIAAKQVAAVAAAPKKGPAHAQAKPAASAAPQNKPATLPSKPLPPAQAVREARSENSRGGRGSGRGGGGRGYGRGRDTGGFNRDYANNENSFSSAPEDGDAGKTTERRGYVAPRGRGGRRGGFNNGDATDGERPRRAFERHSGTGRGNEFKREGAGRGNWGRSTDEFSEVPEEAVNETEKSTGDEKPVQEDDAAGVNTENPAKELEETEPEDKEMTLEEYQKLLEEKRKSLMALKTTEERKVDAKEFASMQQLSSKKENNDIFIKLGSDKDKRKEITDKEERAKKSLSINEFLRPAEGERQYALGGRGRGRGRGSRGGYSGSSMSNVAAPSIEDPGQFPTLGAK
ncbi:RGG repeats nuclear RNA binding protein A-like [Momordica charantia]|uniref:RGG repeats nuclear RNA binding protein A-like n=1 Tax=Momordica charantia TaxID=3673 RepID=A0A6J1DRV5_MOMCH|nr:RGG repeats nuclear RNA binding protein A-like [Momordica charantia]